MEPESLWGVLILVLMEYALEDIDYVQPLCTHDCLNPCFNGICSRRYTKDQLRQRGWFVLILVLMEYALEGHGLHHQRRRLQVLILVLMEYALEVCRSTGYDKNDFRLNPCFSGICSRRRI